MGQSVRHPLGSHRRAVVELMPRLRTVCKAPRILRQELAAVACAPRCRGPGKMARERTLASRAAAMLVLQDDLPGRQLVRLEKQVNGN
jgi:hypothetical protein